MSIPLSKLVIRDFHSKGEENIVQNKGRIKVPLTDPYLNLIDDLSLHKQEMSKPFIYVLYNQNWVIKKNNFKMPGVGYGMWGGVVQLWSFRMAKELWLTLRKKIVH